MKLQSKLIVRTLWLTVLPLLFTLLSPSVHADAVRGKAAFVQNGCWGCHGFEGQGGIAGPKLAPETKPLEYFNAFVRNTRGIMPPYSEKVLSAQDMADLHAYLKSIPKGPDYTAIPLLNTP